MATTTSPVSYAVGLLDRQAWQSAANAQLAGTVPTGNVRRLRWVAVKYSAAVTQTVTIQLDSGAGAAWDHTLPSIELVNATDGLFIPDHDFPLMDDDALIVTAPAGGSAVTSAISVYSDIL